MLLVGLLKDLLGYTLNMIDSLLGLQAYNV